MDPSAFVGGVLRSDIRHHDDHLRSSQHNRSSMARGAGRGIIIDRDSGRLEAMSGPIAPICNGEPTLLEGAPEVQKPTPRFSEPEVGHSRVHCRLRLPTLC